MSETILTSNESYRIILNTFKRFEVQLKEQGEWQNLKTFDTYEEAELYLDARQKRDERALKNKIGPLQFLDAEGLIQNITSIEQEKYGLYGRVNSKKVWLDYNCYKDIEINRQMFTELNELKKRIGVIRESLVKLSPSEIIMHFDGKEATQ